MIIRAVESAAILFFDTQPCDDFTLCEIHNTLMRAQRLNEQTVITSRQF